MPDPTTPFGVTTPMPGSDQFLWDEAQRVGGMEDANQAQQNNFLSNAFNQTQSTLMGGIPTNLLLSRAADATGMRARGAMDRMRASIGARGIDPNSGAATGLLARLKMQQSSDMTGALRDISIEDHRSRQIGAAQNWSNALGLAQFRNQSPSMVPLDTATNLAELRLGREGINAQAASQRRASKDNFLSSLITGGAGLLASIW